VLPDAPLPLPFGQDKPRTSHTIDGLIGSMAHTHPHAQLVPMFGTTQYQPPYGGTPYYPPPPPQPVFMAPPPHNGSTCTCTPQPCACTTPKAHH
jgi:hypothetical protein